MDPGLRIFVRPLLSLTPLNIINRSRGCGGRTSHACARSCDPAGDRRTARAVVGEGTQEIGGEAAPSVALRRLGPLFGTKPGLMGLSPASLFYCQFPFMGNEATEALLMFGGGGGA